MWVWVSVDGRCQWMVGVGVSGWWVSVDGGCQWMVGVGVSGWWVWVSVDGRCR